MLGYSASGSTIDYYNTADGLNGTGFVTELTIGREVNWLTYPPQLNQVWVDSIRAINYTMFRQAIDRKRFTFPVESKTPYVHDPKVIRHDDANGSGYQRKAGEDIPQRPTACRACGSSRTSTAWRRARWRGERVGKLRGSRPLRENMLKRP